MKYVLMIKGALLLYVIVLFFSSPSEATKTTKKILTEEEKSAIQTPMPTDRNKIPEKLQEEAIQDRTVQPFTLGEQTMEVMATAYYKPLPNQKRFLMGSYRAEVEMNGQGIATFVGNPPLIGSVAVDPTVIAFGTPMEIPGYGLGIAEDKGRDIKGRRIDLFMGEGDEGLQKCLDWGSKRITINIRKKS
jgi:3D (Asp-Asp-Asp) domain-containing protein